MLTTLFFAFFLACTGETIAIEAASQTKTPVAQVRAALELASAAPAAPLEGFLACSTDAVSRGIGGNLILSLDAFSTASDHACAFSDLQVSVESCLPGEAEAQVLIPEGADVGAALAQELSGVVAALDVAEVSGWTAPAKEWLVSAQGGAFSLISTATSSGNPSSFQIPGAVCPMTTVEAGVDVDGEVEAE